MTFNGAIAMDLSQLLLLSLVISEGRQTGDAPIDSAVSHRQGLAPTSKWVRVRDRKHTNGVQ
jgi:hypothetical protein